MAAGLPKVSIPKASGGSKKASYDLDSEVTWHHLLYIVLVRVVMNQPRLKHEEEQTFPFKGSGYREKRIDGCHRGDRLPQYVSSKVYRKLTHYNFLNSN